MSLAWREMDGRRVITVMLLVIAAGATSAGCSSIGGAIHSTTTTLPVTTTIGPPAFSGYGLDNPVGRRYEGVGPKKLQVQVGHAKVEFGVWCLGPGGISVTIDGEGGPFPTKCTQFAMHTAFAGSAVGQQFTVDITVAPSTRWVMQAFRATG